MKIQISMVLMGFCFRLWAIHTNKGFNLLLVKPQGICMAGPYKYIRHPAYLGSLVLCAGLFSLCAGWIGGLPAWLVLLVLLTHTARHEELILLFHFSEYADYKKRTGMLLPRIWRVK